MTSIDSRSGRCRGGFDLAKRVVRRFVSEEDGQDLIEYALLAAAIATAGMLALNAIGPAVGLTYNSWIDPTTGPSSLWDPPAPAGS